MNDVTIKIARKGEGKTKWLLEVAHEYQLKGQSVTLITEDPRDFDKFCEKYFTTYAEICKVNMFKMFEPVKDHIILIDNILKLKYDIPTIAAIQRECDKMFITIEGVCSETVVECPVNFEQLSIFDGIREGK